ncbi:hypothetical protein C7H19_19365 [Aphanothece hegewaldii CCALA 016]|uniref:DUF2513 domain-containing protein n=1 Tax=Aphanothece hegewaldii CCALA 016 TaxID=2107694 RepID=A0A2T1LTF1_9CHRO|nr:DUF2513 domain-containing protein [Aphanothece hegewaldii]PSF33884.1 hypothetical protein C7H19_19365 [Aphanothece hegewaldii CCALA 016]
MKRDMELVRKILLKIEESNTYDEPIDIEIEGYTQSSINFHVAIMKQGGLVELFGNPIATFDSSTSYFPSRLTWQGCEFLDASRNENVWQRALKTIKEKGGGVAFEVIKALLIQYAKEELSISSR